MKANHGDWTPIGEVEWVEGLWWIRWSTSDIPEIAEVGVGPNGRVSFDFPRDPYTFPSPGSAATHAHGPLNPPEWHDAAPDLEGLAQRASS